MYCTKECYRCGKFETFKIEDDKIAKLSKTDPGRCPECGGTIWSITWTCDICGDRNDVSKNKCKTCGYKLVLNIFGF